MFMRVQGVLTHADAHILLFFLHVLLGQPPIFLYFIVFLCSLTPVFSMCRMVFRCWTQNSAMFVVEVYDCGMLAMFSLRAGMNQSLG